MLRRLLLLAALLAGCVGEPNHTGILLPPPPAPVVRSVAVTPAEAVLAPGEAAQFQAVVDADAGLSREVVWRSRNPEIVTVSATGLAVATACGPDDMAVVEAVAVADTTKRGTAQAGRRGRAATQFPTIVALTDSVTGADVPPSAISGTVAAVVRHPRPGCPIDADAVRIVVRGPGVDTIVASLGVLGALAGPFTLHWPTAALTNGSPVFPNGNYGIVAEAMYPTRTAPVAGNAIPVVLTNP